MREKVLPLLLSGTLAFGTMGVPMTAIAQSVGGYDTGMKVGSVKADLDKKVAAGDITEQAAEKILKQFKAAVAEENEAALAAQEEAQAEEEAEAPAEGDSATDAEGEADSESGADNADDNGAADDNGDDAEGGDNGAADDEDGEGSGTDEGGEGDSGEAADDDGQGADDAADDAGNVKAGDEGDATLPAADEAQADDQAKPGKGGKKDAAEAEAAATDEQAAAEDKVARAKHAKKDKASKEEAYQKASKEYADQAAARADLDAATAVKSSVYDSSYVSSNQGYTRIKYTANLSTEMFIASIGEQARQICQEKSLYASVMIAQAVIESDSGNSGLAKAPYNNLFGIKGSYQGKSVTMSTQEDNGKGNLYTIDSAFRAYDTQADSLADYADLLRGDMGHYYNAWKENADTYEDAARALQGTYATSTVYADSICAVIEAYDLTRYDEALDFTITGKDADGNDLTMDDYAQLQANAVSFLGTPYVWGGTTPDGFDCSGFVQYLYKQAFGIELPRTTYTQQNEGEEVSFKDLQMGDLLFFAEGGSTEHVAMYLGDGFYIHAPEPGDSIKITDMESFTPTFAKRIIQTEAVA